MAHINSKLGYIIRIFHGSEMRIEQSVRGSLFGITRLCQVMPNSDPEGWNFLSAPNNHDRFFFLHTFPSPAFDFNVGVAINESHSSTLTITILEVNVIWAAPSKFGTYRLFEQRRFRRACASAQSRQNLRCSLIQAVSQEEPSDRKPDLWPL